MTTRELGSGGNGDVWEVTNSHVDVAAIKVLRDDQQAFRDRFDRFRDEIEFLIKHPDYPGILPLLDHCLSTTPSEPSWYVMPVAAPIRAALSDDPAPLMVVSAIATIAETLAALATQGVGHRDIKPDNLFRLDDQWVIGDFGLVTYPEKDPLTEHGRKLGPTDFMAPEMRIDADQALAEPADVWALAKTLWALLTGQLPLPGTHNPVEETHTLRERITFNRVAELDLLLERATQIDPRKRLSMREVAEELQACVVTPPETNPSAGLSQLHARLAALTASSHRQISDAQDRRVRANQAWRELEEVAREAYNELRRLLTFNGPVPGSAHHAAMRITPDTMPYATNAWGCQLVPPGQHPGVEVTIEAAMVVTEESGPADIAALLRIDCIVGENRLHEEHEVWSGAYRGILVGSAQQAQIFAEIRAGFVDGFDEILRKAIEFMSKTDQ